MIIGVLDDNAALCHILETVLAIAGHKVYAYTDPTTFVTSIHHDNIDNPECIIVDFSLPGGKSGIEVISQVRQEYPSLPAILISGDPLSQTILQGLANVAFCPKPFHLATLLGFISNLQKT